MTGADKGGSMDMKSNGERKRKTGKSRGQSLVELCLVMPLLMLICLGTIDLGRMFYGYTQMTNAVREGASISSHQPENWGEAQAVINSHSSNLPAGYTLACPACSLGTEAGDEVTITATWSFQPITFDLLGTFWGLGDPISMSTHATMRVL
jgi:Flp pilus assembly protein TadG